jgi:cytochrome P450
MGILFALIRTNVLQRLKEETQDPEAAENGRKDMFHYLFHTKDSESGGRAYSEDDLAIEAGLLLTTALGATSTTLSAFYFYITRNSYIYKKLIEEIRATFTSADDIHGSAVLSCSYLRACLDETLRMTPASPSEAIRIVLPGGLEVDRQFLPEGVAVGSSSWSLFHDDSYFRDPWVYRPERWIVDEALGVSAADVARAQLAFLPFSIGPVNCVGQKLARSILLVTIAKTLFRFDVASPQGDKVGEGSDHLGWGRRDRNVFQVRDATFALRQGPMVCFKEREIT